ncbi:hypothetical protein, partial [Bradyrhizobium macuxiense]|uniref:hypothetical protein n=1 Tax=Bradyrhizobium macuxiense TaxID=1755647 RepID=UPI00142F0126
GSALAGGGSDTVTVHATASDTYGNTVGVSDTDSASYGAASPSVNIEKLVSVNGGSTWYLIDDTDHGTSDDIAFLESLVIGGTHPFNSTNLSAGTLTVSSGSTLTYEVVVTDTSTFKETGITVTDNTGLVFTVGTTLAAGASEISGKVTIGAAAGVNPDTVTVTATATDSYGNSAVVTDSDTAVYMSLFPQMPGLTAGFWAQHLDAWDGDNDNTYANLVKSGVLSTPDVISALPTHGVVPYGTSPTTDRPPHVTANVGVLLGDANGNGSTDTGESTLSVPWLAAEELVSGSMTTSSDARLILMQQAVAAQLNIDNKDSDPGLLSAGSGNDLVGTAVKWLTGQLAFSDGHTPSATYNVDNGPTNGVLDSGPNATFEFNTSKATLDYGGSLDFIKTSSTDWSAVQIGNYSKDGYFVVADRAQTAGTVLNGKDVVVTGQDLKNALAAFNSDQLVTTTNGSQIGWNSNGVISDVQTNDQAGMWKVLTDHGIGIATSQVTV